MTEQEQIDATRKAIASAFGGEVEAIVIEDAGDWTVTLNVGHADERVCTCDFRDHALAIARALDAVFLCGVYEDGWLITPTAYDDRNAR